MPLVDVHFIVYPIIRKFLKFDINEINVESLEGAVKSHIGRDTYETVASSLSALDSDSNKFSLNVMFKGSMKGSSDIDK